MGLSLKKASLLGGPNCLKTLSYLIPETIRINIMDELFDVKDSNNPFLQFNDSPVNPVRKRAKTQRRAQSLPTNKSSAGYNLGDLLVPQTSITKKGGKRKYSAPRRVKEHFSFDIPYPTGGFDLEDDMSMLKIPNSPKSGRKTQQRKAGRVAATGEAPATLRTVASVPAPLLENFEETTIAVNVGSQKRATSAHTTSRRY